MSNHTPGPWHCEVSQNSFGDIGRAVFSSEELKPGTFKYVVLANSHLSEADMILIAAAPELLEACKALIDLANESEVQPKSRDWQIFQTLLKKSNAGILAKAAITKAEGK